MAEYRTSAYASVGAVDEDAIKKYILGVPLKADSWEA